MPKRQKTVIVRVTRPIPIDPFGQPNTLVFDTIPGVTTCAAPDVYPPAISVDMQDLDAHERAELAQEPDVLQAPSMDFSSIMPFHSLAAVDTPPPVSWGVSRSKAASLPVDAGRGAVVAVLDTGIDHDHSAFDGIEIDFENFTDETDDDLDGQGTHSAATIFGRSVDGCRIGVARGVQRALIGKVLGARGNNTARIVRGIMWARNAGAHIVCMALTADFNAHREGLVAEGYHPKEATALTLSNYRENMRLFNNIGRLFSCSGPATAPLIIAAAGNDSERPRFTISVAPPACADGIVAVGAVDEGMRPALFSNTGPDLCAPGVEIWSARAGGGVVAMSGTSTAAAHVAGVAAVHAAELVRQNDFSPCLLRERLVQNIRAVPGRSRRDVGAGLIQI